MNAVALQQDTSHARAHRPAGGRFVLNTLFSLLVVVVTLAVLLMNVGMTKCFAGSPPTGERAMGLVVPFFGMMIAIVLMTLAALLACFRVSASGFGTIHSNAMLSGFVTVALTFGATLSAGVAFMLWCEPGAAGKSLRGILMPVELLIGGFGPIVLAAWLLVSMWNTKDAIAANATHATALKALFWSVVVLAAIGYAVGGLLLWHSVSPKVVSSVRGLKREAEQVVESGGHRFKPIATQVELELAHAPADAPLKDFVMYFPEGPHYRKLNEKATTMILERALQVKNFDESLKELMTCSDYIYRQGAAEMLRFMPQEQIDAHKDQWGESLILGVGRAADGVECRPAWLTEHFDLNPDPMAHVASLLAASERFKGWTGYPRLQEEFQRMTDATSGLKEDKYLPKFLKMLANAGYKPAK